MRRLKKFYGGIRHDTRVLISFISNYIILRRLRHKIKTRNSDRKLIAIHLIEHLGDIVACEPISRYVRQQNPDAFIFWSVKKVYRELVDSNPYIDKTVIVHCLSERLLLSRSKLFDKEIDLHFPDRYCSLCTIPLKKTDGRTEVHLGNYFDYGGLLAALSRSAGLPAIDEPPRVYIPPGSIRRVDSLNLPERFIAVNCSSNNPEKDWPDYKWRELIDKMVSKHGMAIVELGISPLDFGNPNSQYINLCGGLSILESAEVIRRARLFIGIDSGPAHMANAVGTPGVILMGTYLGFKRYMPFSGSYGRHEDAEILYAEGPACQIPVEKVVRAVSKVIR